MNNFGFVTVNKNQDLWMIDYDRQFAVRSSIVTIDDLKTNNNAFVQHDDSIVDFLESRGFIVDDSKYNEDCFKFNNKKEVKA